MRTRTRRRQFREEAAILAALLAGDVYVTDIWKRTGLPPSRIYQTLARLEQTGQVHSWFEPGPEPRRRRYEDALRHCWECGGTGIMS